MVKVLVPDLGEEVKEATISYWYYEEGDMVHEGDNLVEISTDKATFNVQSPANGTLVEVMFEEGDQVHSQDLLAKISIEDSEGEENG
ncbi:MAG: biotin/lipoyl-containing protein [Candidatus Omnitrophota bacterium]